MTRPKREWKVGDRVAVYDISFQRGVNLSREVGKVDYVGHDGMLRVRVPGSPPYFVHPKQLRRLVPRKRRSWEGRWMKAGELMTGSVVFAPSSSVIDLAPLLDESRTTLIEAPKSGRR